MKNKREKVITIRVSESEKLLLEKYKNKLHFNTISEYIRFISLNHKLMKEG